MPRATWTEHPRLVSLRRRFPMVNAGVDSVERFTVHRTGRNSALVAHYAFLSVFPLLLVFTTVIGFVLDSNPKLRDEILDSVLSRIPILGPELVADPQSLSGSVPVLVVGLLVTLWGSLKAFNVLQMALDDIAEVPWEQRPTMMVVRLRSFIGVVILGGGQVAAAVLTGLLAVSGVAVAHRLLLFLAATLTNGVVLAATYHYLCTRRPAWRRVLPGAVAGGVLFAGMQVLGTTIVARAITRASPVYGAFATVIGLITWLSLHSMVLLLGAELNGVLPLRPYHDTEDPKPPL